MKGVASRPPLLRLCVLLLPHRVASLVGQSPYMYCMPKADARPASLTPGCNYTPLILRPCRHFRLWMMSTSRWEPPSPSRAAKALFVRWTTTLSWPPPVRHALLEPLGAVLSAPWARTRSRASSTTASRARWSETFKAWALPRWSLPGRPSSSEIATRCNKPHAQVNPCRFSYSSG